MVKHFINASCSPVATEGTAQPIHINLELTVLTKNTVDEKGVYMIQSALVTTSIAC